MIRRRRECERCSRRFTTYERVEEMMPLVVKKDGRRESYDRIKIINGLKRACEKRPVSINTIETITDRIERALQERGEKEIPELGDRRNPHARAARHRSGCLRALCFGLSLFQRHQRVYGRARRVAQRTQGRAGSEGRRDQAEKRIASLSETSRERSRRKISAHGLPLGAKSSGSNQPQSSSRRRDRSARKNSRHRLSPVCRRRPRRNRRAQARRRSGKRRNALYYLGAVQPSGPHAAVHRRFDSRRHQGGCMRHEGSQSARRRTRLSDNFAGPASRCALGVLEKECRALIEAFAKYITRRMPFVTLKLAVTLDGRIATASGDARWISGDKSRNTAHRLRNEVDAVIVGLGTIRADDPLLTCRIPGGRNPWRVVLDSRLSIPLSAKILRLADPGKTIIATGVNAAAAKIRSRGSSGSAGLAFARSKASKCHGGRCLKRLLVRVSSAL